MKKHEIVDRTKSKTVRGKYIHLLEAGSNVAILDRDILEHFPNSESVNNALRAFLVMRDQFASVNGSAERPVRRATRRAKPPAFDPRTGLNNQEVVATK